MSTQRYRSFEELGQVQQERRRASASRASPQVSASGTERLWVQVHVAPHAERSADHECRSIVLDWLQESFEDRLPRRALRHRSFSIREEGASCRAVRVRGAGKDQWALQVERSSGPGRQVVTSVTVASVLGRSTVIGIEVHDRSVVSSDAVLEYPSELLAEIAGRVPLLQNGRRFARHPIVLDTEDAMNSFLQMLVDRGRDMPFAVVSVPPEEPDVEMLEEQWRGLARALAGLAVVWVLPPAMTFRLSDTVGKPLSVFLGAWRFYRPGFNDRADRARHPLVLWNRLTDERGLGLTTRQFQRLAAEERQRFGRGDRETLGFDAIARTAVGAGRGPARLVSFLRNRIWGAAAGSAGPGRTPREERRGTRGADGAAAATGAAEETPLLQRKLKQARDKAQVRATRYEQAKQRADAAERERDVLRRRAEQLAGLVRSLGGDPDAEIPFPATWDEVAAWCDQSLEGRVSLTGSARRELGGAEFLDVALAAQCLSWLGYEYRDGRIDGGDPELHGRISEIDDGVFNLPSGGDSFECTWDGRRHTVDWHIKRGANTRDPRRCLRIYYFWDDDTRRVVVASMPAHRRNALS
ncbi:MAG: hypothetical protein F4087_00150 [Gemmatimonadetes bacterium]|nr:hypothetical protein [Gemmatimonadota bacterium]MYA10736.1 hypothetical protein [Gemmatimonadota bacterium]MYE70685.1 hypothetical protein [Gemmatimonadota bacterium]MYJ66908.1 hypothetical protein [Gemmatimonadota bacterium]